MQNPVLTSSPLSSHDSLLLALFVAFLLHIGIVLGIHFKAPDAKKADRSIEITLSHAPLKKAPKDARFLAADHQLGAGDETRKPQPVKQHLPSPPPAEPVPKAAEKQIKHSEKKPEPQHVLTQTTAPVKTASAPEAIEEAVEQPQQQRPHLTPEALQQQITQLGEQIRTSQQSSESSKIKSVSSVSTHKYLAAQYVKDWENKVERTGNLNYPEAARKKGAAQMLT
ncbi:MAG: energy transducer TonB, partial [Methylomonas sp.]